MLPYIMMNNVCVLDSPFVHTINNIQNKNGIYMFQISMNALINN